MDQPDQLFAKKACEEWKEAEAEAEADADVEEEAEAEADAADAEVADEFDNSRRRSAWIWRCCSNSVTSARKQNHDKVISKVWPFNEAFFNEAFQQSLSMKPFNEAFFFFNQTKSH